MKFSPENILYYEEYKDKVQKESREYNENIIRTVLEDPTFRVGEGTSADVYFIPEAPTLCIKIISKNKTQTNHELGRIKILPHNSVEECRLTAKAATASRKAIVPMPLFVFGVADPEHDDQLDVVCMQRLDAVTLEEVLTGVKSMPEAFNLEKFSAQLQAFLDEIHEAKIYHMDLHGGNVMIDNKTGDLCVIDFGASKELWGGEEEPNIDESCRKKIIKDLRDYTLTK